MQPPTVGTIVPGKGRLNADGTFTPVEGMGTAIPDWQLAKYDPQNQNILDQLYQSGWRGEDSVLQSIFGNSGTAKGLPGSTLTGATPRDYSNAYGGIPTVPDPIASLRTALTGNLGSLGDLYQLAVGGSEASAAGARTQLQANLPLATQLLGQRSQNILSNLQGNISTGLTNRLGQIAAERGVGFGPDSPSTTAAYLAATGRSIEDLQNLGQQQLATAIGTTPMGPQFNPMQFMLNPSDYQQWQMYANTLAAAPVPSAAAQAAEEAARRGMTAGAGAVGSPGGSRFPSSGVYQAPVHTGSWAGPSSTMVTGNQGTYYGGVLYPTGTTPSSATTNWYNWLSGLPTSTGTGTGSMYMGGLSGAPGDTSGGFTYMGNPTEFYDYFGFTPEEWGGVGGSWEDLYGGSESMGDEWWSDISPYSLEAFGITP